MAIWPTTSHASPPTLPPGVEPSSRHILVVHEEIGEATAVATNLSGAGYSVECAATASEALKQIRDSEVELVLLGESLPGMTGLDLLRLLRAAWSPQQLPIIMMAEESRGELEMEALAAGANDCIAPSIAGGRALARIQSQLRQRDAGRGARERAERIFRATAVSTDVIWEWNVATGTFWISSEWSRLAGIPATRQARLPTCLEDWLAHAHPEDAPALEAAINSLRRDFAQFEFDQEYRIVAASGEVRWIYCRATIERDRDGTLLRLTGLQTDITRNKSIDWLTQLPNRENILEQIDRLLGESSPNPPRPFALLLLDLDRFRVVNESLGAAAGDQVLREIAMRLERVGRSTAVGGLARIHGDSFLLILNGIDDQEAARGIADRLQSEVRRPLHLAGREIRLSASIGIALSSSDVYTRAFELLRDAEIALHQAKALGRARSVGFESEMRRDALHRMDIEIDLRHALEHQEFVLHYQPKIDLDTGALSGFEALIRWRHPRLGLIPPLKFIPVAEETGMIIPIGTWAIEESARQFATWTQLYPGAKLQVSVNLSVKQFFDRELIDRVDALVRGLRLPPRDFCLEVTESVLIGEMQSAAEILRRLHGAGVGLMIDDFGTGYSALNYLTNLPFDALKIDRSFITRIELDENCAEVVKAVVTLAGNLKLDVIAEGVETQEQIECLQRVGCRFAQGFYFAKPVDAATATGMVLASRPAFS